MPTSPLDQFSPHSCRGRHYRYSSNHHHNFHGAIPSELVQTDMALQQS